MSLGIKWGNAEDKDLPSGFIYIDAVTSFTQDFRGTVTKHPVDASASIADHYVRENPVYNISGVVSGVDLSRIPSALSTDLGVAVAGAQQRPFSVSFKEEGNGLLQFLPDSIGQFLGKKKPTPFFDTSTRSDLNREILVKDLVEGIMQGLRYNSKTDKVEPYIQLVELYEFDGINIRDITSDLVITSFRVREDVDTGDALWLDLTLEQVFFATLEKAELPKDVVDKLKKPVETKKNKGKVSSTPKDCAAAQVAGDSTAPQTDSSNISLAKERPSVLTQIVEGTIGVLK